MRKWILAFASGVTLAGFAPALPDVSDCLLLFIPVVLSLRFRVMVLPGACCLGIWWLCILAIRHQDNILPATLEQQDLTITGIVTGLPQASGRSTRFVLVTDHLCGPGNEHCTEHGQGGRPGKLLLNDYGGGTFLPGQVWQLTVRLKRPHGFANPGGFDYERWLFQERITATGYVRDNPGNRLLDEAGNPSLVHLFDKLRYRFRQRLDIAGLQAPGFLNALTIGERYRISAADWQLLTITGTNHLMVISGLHISLVTWLAYRFGFFIFRFCPVFTLCLPARRLACIPAIGGAVFYAGLAGFSLPVQRALVMVCCVLSGQLLVRQTRASNSLCLALGTVLLLDPLAPQDGGFWLSFIAVSCLLFALEPRHEPLSLWHKMQLVVRTQALLFLGMAPVLGFLFQQVTLLAPLVNLVAIPFVGTLVVPLCLFALIVSMVRPGWFEAIIRLPDFLLVEFTRVLNLCAGKFDFLQLDFPALPVWLTALLVGGMAMVLLLPGRRRSLIPLGALCILMLYRPDRPVAGTFALDILDVGQGLAAVVTTREHVLVYDTGPAFSPRFNAGSGIVLPYLRRRGLPSPDMVMVSHSDTDHAGGLNGLLDAYPGIGVMAGEAIAGVPATACRAGQHWTWDEVTFWVLAPIDESATGNNASCVLKISTGPYAVLLPGDIEQSVELALVRHYGDALSADVLVAPHHGSLTSSTTPFIRHVGATGVVFTSGYLNRFGHPHPRVTARYLNQQAVLFNTADTGAIHYLLSAGDGVLGPRLFRLDHRRFWSRGPETGTGM